MIDQKYIEIYYDTVFSYCEGLIPLRSFSEKGKAEIVFPSWIEANKDTALGAIKTFAEYVDKKQASALCIPGTVKERGKARALDIEEMQVLVVDIDNGDIEAKLTHARIHLGIPTLIVESGGEYEGQKKLHVYWKLNEVATGADLANLIEMRRKLALKIGGDVHFASAHQPIRIAGTIYHKSDEARLVNIREHTGLEYSLYDLEDNIVYMHGLTGIDSSTIQLDSHKLKKTQAGDLFKQTIRAGSLDSVSRFSAISTVIGYFLRRVRENHMTLEEAISDIYVYNELKISPSWERSRLDREVRSLLQRDIEKYGEFTPIVESEEKPKRTLVKYRSEKIVDSDEEDPIPYLKNGILEKGGFMLVAGPPKVGKSQFIINLLVNMYLGKPYLDIFIPTRPLKIFYLQFEMKKSTLRKRLKVLESFNSGLLIPKEEKEWLDITVMKPGEDFVLDDRGIQEVTDLILEDCENETPDIICVDPLTNLFYAPGHDDNTVAGMKEFCRRLKSVRNKINPDIGIILVHHTKKITGSMLKEDIFNAVAGSSFLRRIYDTGIVFFRHDEALPNSVTMRMEIRDAEVDQGFIERVFLKQRGEFVDSNNNDDSKKTDTPNKNLELKLLDLIKSEALEGRFYTMSNFGRTFANKEGLPSDKTIRRSLDKLAAHQSIKFFNNPESYGFEESFKLGSMFVCIPDMNFKIGGNYGVIKHTHFKCPSEGKIKNIKNIK